MTAWNSVLASLQFQGCQEREFTIILSREGSLRVIHQHGVQVFFIDSRNRFWEVGAAGPEWLSR